MAQNNDYWIRRAEQLEEAQNRKAKKYYSGLKKQYAKAASEVQKDIDTWYSRFAVNNQITLQEARKILTKNELEEFHWNVMDYIAKGRENAINHQWEKQLENASAKWHISRLEALKIQMQNHVEQLYDGQQLSMADFLVDVYTDNYYHQAYEIMKGYGVGYDLMRLDTDKIAKVVSKPWAADGSNFSDRIWKHKAQLVSELHNGLTQSIIRGQDSKALIEHISKRFEVSEGQAARLVMTETAFVQSASTRDSYKELDVEEYEIVATLDRKTSELCRDMDGKHFPLSQYEIGVTAPIFHCWCRTTTAPFFDDEFELGAERAARGDDGSTYFVPASMKYPEWKEKFVDGGSKEGLIILSASVIPDMPLSEDYANQTVTITEKDYNSDYGIVDRKLVNSKVYHDKFENLTEHKPVNEALYQESMRMLEHRDGTIYEDMIVIDARKGTVLERFTESTEAGKVRLTDEESARFMAYTNDIILLHNHPNGSRPSYKDILNLKRSNVKAVVASGHDGSVYIVSELDKNFNIDEFWKKTYNGYKQIFSDDILANHRATDDLYSLKVFKIERR